MCSISSSLKAICKSSYFLFHSSRSLSFSLYSSLCVSSREFHWSPPSLFRSRSLSPFLMVELRLVSPQNGMGRAHHVIFLIRREAALRNWGVSALEFLPSQVMPRHLSASPLHEPISVPLGGTGLAASQREDHFCGAVRMAFSSDSIQECDGEHRQLRFF